MLKDQPKTFYLEETEFFLIFVDLCIIVQFLQRKPQQYATVYQSFIIPYLHKAEHVLGNTPPIIRSLKLH
jgi:hypothetical protein